MRKSRGIFMGVLALLLVTTGCSSSVGDKWAAKVNGEAILVEDYDTRVAEAQKIYENQGMKFDTEEGKAALPQLKSQLLESMIYAKLFTQDVKNQNLDPENAKVKEQEDIIKKNIGDDKFQDTLKQQGMTEDELKNYLTVYEKVTSDVKELSEDEVKAFFDKNVAHYSQPESIKAHHILVSTEDEAKAIIKQLESAAKDKTEILPLFEQLAKEKSTEPAAKESGGNLGTFAKGEMVPEFETAAFAQEAGTFSTTPVKTEFGYHVILVETHTPAIASDYATVKAQVAQDALNAAKDEKFQTYFNDLRTKAEIKYAKGYEPSS